MEATQPTDRKRIPTLSTKKTRQQSKSGLKRQKAMAKIGMAGSLGTLVVSGFFKFQGAKSLHIYSGLGLLVCTMWHHLLNQPKSGSKRRPQ